MSEFLGCGSILPEIDLVLGSSDVDNLLVDGRCWESGPVFVSEAETLSLTIVWNSDNF